MDNRVGSRGALAGLLVTVPLMGVLYLAAQVGGLPFAPYDLFDWLALVLPGGLVTAVIDGIVVLVNGLGLGETSSAANAIEHGLALVIFGLLGILIGVAFFAWSGQHGRANRNSGLILGLLVAVLMIVVHVIVNRTATAAPLPTALWLVVAFGGWGAALGWLAERLQVASPVPLMPASGPGAQPVAANALDRRQFLVRAGGAAAVITVAGAGLGSLLAGRRAPALMLEGTPEPPGLPDFLPNAGDPVQAVSGTRLEYTPLEDHFRLDISLVPPSIDGTTWTLPITGLVDTPLSLTLDDLHTRYEPLEEYVTLACISNPIGGDLIGTTRWTGASLKRVLVDAGVQEGAQYLVITAADRFHETVTLDLVNADERIMLCYAWDGQPLKPEFGFPLRLFIPDLYGMKTPKWITGIEVVADYQEGYWVRRGWDEVARVRMISTVDAVAAVAEARDDGALVVPVGGMAYAGARGISKVEVQVDDGAWQEAQLRRPLSETAWTIWRYEWPFQPGEHTFAVRAYDGLGIVQDEQVRGPSPSGASGIHRKRATAAAPSSGG